MEYAYDDLDRDFEQKYVDNLVKFLGLKYERELKILLEGSKCLIRPTGEYSIKRFGHMETTVYFLVQLERFSLEDKYDKQKLLQYCDNIMPPSMHYHITRVEVSPLIEEIGEESDLNSSIDGKDKIVVPSSQHSPKTEKLVKPNLVSLMMPFDSKFDKVSETIKAACSNLEFDCMRVDDIWDNSVIIKDICGLIYCSSIVIVDFSGKNPNVCYEAGIAHALRKNVIPITQSEHDIPFDLSLHRFIIYLNNSEGLEELRTKLEGRLKTLRENSKS